jgi:hypothetical protein
MGNKLTTDWQKAHYGEEKYLIGNLNQFIARIYSLVIPNDNNFYLRGPIKDVNHQMIFKSLEEAKTYADKILINQGYSVIPDKLKSLI